MNRAERVLQYMRDFGSITPLECMRDLGYMRLACAISDLKKDGHTIRKVYETKKNRYEIPVTYARYSLVEKNENQVN